METSLKPSLRTPDPRRLFLNPAVRSHPLATFQQLFIVKLFLLRYRSRESERFPRGRSALLGVLTCWRPPARANMLAREQETFVFQPKYWLDPTNRGY